MSSSCKNVLASEVSSSFLSILKSEVAAKDSAPVLIGFLANEDKFAIKYASYTRRCCEDIGVTFELRTCSRNDLEERLDEANADPRGIPFILTTKVDGIMIYYPVFGGDQDQYLQNTVAITKDVEGLSSTYRSNMYRNVRYMDDAKLLKCIIPCTPLAIIKILEFTGVYNKILEAGNQLHGKTITVINRSEVVGRPLAALMANDGANVISIDVENTLLFSRGI
jgi:methylenetetrahydrofolate dehydrogenase (NAD+)